MTLANLELTRPNGSPWYTINPNLVYGENLARYHLSASDAIVGLMNSPGHKDNMLSSRFDSLGTGVISIDGDYYYIQLFN